MLRNASFSRIASVSLRAGLLILFVGGLMTATTGCSWFKSGGDSEMIVEPPSDMVDTADAVVGDLAEVTPPDSPKEGPRPGDMLAFPELKVIYFDFDRSNIRPDQLANIEFNLKYLLSNLDAKVVIEGHCDERGTVEYNFALGERRAKAVRGYYIKNGVAPERIVVLSKGEEEPSVLGKTEDAFSKNRRSEFKRMY